MNSNSQNLGRNNQVQMDVAEQNRTELEDKNNQNTEKHKYYQNNNKEKRKTKYINKQ